MRILHIGTGYPPIGSGGLTRYALDLMAAQAAAGHEIFYLCAGDYDLGFRPRLKRWRLGQISVLELRNSRVESYTPLRQRRPEREISDAATERLITEAITAGIRHSAFGFRDNNDNSEGRKPFVTAAPKAESRKPKAPFGSGRSESRKPKAESRLPDVVHLHNLMGWPVSLLGLLAERGIPVVYTVQNYHAVCPTTRLYDEPADELCEDFAEGRRCARCNAAKPSAAQFRTLRRFRIDRAIRCMPGIFAVLRGIKRLVFRKPRNSACLTQSRKGAKGECSSVVLGVLASWREQSPQEPIPEASAISEVFRRRREAFVGALNGDQLPVASCQLPVTESPSTVPFDELRAVSSVEPLRAVRLSNGRKPFDGALRRAQGGEQRRTAQGREALERPKAESRRPGVTVVAMSNRVAELLVRYGVEASRVRTLPLVLGDFDKIVRRPPRTPTLPLRFGLLNKLTHLKGADVLREAFSGLSRDKVRLLVFGSQSESGVKAIRPLLDSGVAELRGPYERARMNEVLAEVDVGLVPSIWEEPYGYVGVEFLAAGIPVLGSRIGGIPDYIEDGVNGHLLPPRDGAAWRAKIAELAGKPEEVARLAAGIKPVKTMAQHLGEIEALYRKAGAHVEG
jgi:glycosyltransferase involved in cell wall biosynthesis